MSRCKGGYYGNYTARVGGMLHTVLCMLCRYAGALRDELLRYQKETKASLRGSSPATQLSVHIIASNVKVESSAPHDDGYPSALACASIPVVANLRPGIQ